MKHTHHLGVYETQDSIASPCLFFPQPLYVNSYIYVKHGENYKGGHPGGSPQGCEEVRSRTRSHAQGSVQGTREEGAKSMRLCECGCGREVKNRFVRGHNSRVRTEETIEKIRKTLTGRTKENDEGYRLISETLKGRTKETHEYLRIQAEDISKTLKRKYASGEIVHWAKGHTKETHPSLKIVSEKVSKTLTGRTARTHDYIRQHSERMRGRTKENHEGVRRMADTKRGRTAKTHDYIRRQAKTMKQRFASGRNTHWTKTKPKEEVEEIFKKVSKGVSRTLTGRTKETHEGIRQQAEKMRGRKLKPDHINKISEAHKKLCKDSEYRERLLKNTLKGLLKRPTSFEQRIIDLIKKHNLSYKYVGDGEVIIGGKNPDFIETNGKKILIEVYCSYIKERFDKLDNYEQDRYDFFREFGFKTIFLNDDDLFADNWEQRCLDKISKGQL